MSEENLTNQPLEIAVPLKKRIERWAGRMAILLLLKPFQLLPLATGRAMGRGLGSLFYSLRGRYRRVALKNLTLVYGQEKSPEEITQMAKAVFRHFGEMAAEFVKMPRLTQEQIDALAIVEGEAYGNEMLAGGKGALLISGHFGNWEFMMRYFTSHGYHINIVVRDARDPATTKIVSDLRRGAAANILYRGTAAITVVRCLKRNEFVGIMPDQNAADVFAPFFGFPTGTVDGPAVLHLMARSPLLFCWCTRLPNGQFKIEIEPPVVFPKTEDRDADIAAITTLINARLEAQIRRNPTQWLWLHDRWKASPDVFPDGEANRKELKTPLKQQLREAAERKGGSK